MMPKEVCGQKRQADGAKREELALATHDSAVRVLGDETLKKIAPELVDSGPGV